MKIKLFKWASRITVTLGLIFLLLGCIVLNPGLTYASKTEIEQFTIYHNSALDSQLESRLNTAVDILKTSEVYDPNFQIDICFEDGLYVNLISKLTSPAFARGFYNKVVVMGQVDISNNTVAYYNHNWDLERLLAHELVHCYQYNHFGLLNSNPIANHAQWKWEGYAEFIAQSLGKANLKEKINYFLEQKDEKKEQWSILLPDKTEVPLNYYEDALLTAYCLQIKGLTYSQLLNDDHSREYWYESMMLWHT